MFFYGSLELSETSVPVFMYICCYMFLLFLFFFFFLPKSSFLHKIVCCTFHKSCAVFDLVRIYLTVYYCSNDDGEKHIFSFGFLDFDWNFYQFVVSTDNYYLMQKKVKF